MSKRCPEWFPLNTYVVAPSTYAHWIRSLAIRMVVMDAPQPNDWKCEKYKALVLEDARTDWEIPDPGRFLAVRDITAYEGFKLAQLFDTPGNAESKKLAELKGVAPPTEEEMGIRRRVPVAEADGQEWGETFDFRLPVTVDLSLDDKSLVLHFEIWLSMVRAGMKEQGSDELSAPITITHDALDRWHAARVLAAYDLLSWREISGATYSDAAISGWLWPDSGALSDGTFVDRAERLRKVTRPLLERVFCWPTIYRLERAWAGQLLQLQMSGTSNRETDSGTNILAFRSGSE